MTSLRPYIDSVLLPVSVWMMPSQPTLGAVTPVSVTVTSLATNTGSKTSNAGLDDVTETDTSTCVDSVRQMTSSA
jgi:hypothetical protein